MCKPKNYFWLILINISNEDFELEMETGRAGPGLAGLNFLGPRAELAKKRAEIGSRSNQKKKENWIFGQIYI